MLHIQKQMLNLLISALLVSPLAPLSAQSAPVCLTGELGALRQDLGSEEQVLLRQGSEEQALLRQGYEEQVLLRQGYEEQAGDSDGAVMSAQPAYTDPNFHYAGPVGAQLGTSTRSGSRTFDTIGANSLTQLEQLEAQNERAAASVVSPAFYDIGIKPTDLSDVNNSAISPNKSAMYTISRHGRYYVSQDLLANSSNADTAIVWINASNVVLDLNQATITQYGSNTNPSKGIEIAASQSNITIQNGRISSLQGSSGIGIKVNASCKNLVFKNLTIADIQGTTGSGISTAATCSNLVFQDLIVSGCKNNIVLSTSNSVLIRNVQCVNATGEAGAGLTISNGSNIVVLDSIFSFNGGTAAIGVALSTCYSVTIDNCIASNNITASGSNCYGFQLAGCSACWLKNCTASRNSGASTINAGFRLQTNSSGCRFSNCAAFDQRDGSINCGFYFEQGVSNSIIENSHAYAQSAGAAAGIRFAYSAPTAVTNCVVRNCLLYDNVGTSASYGFYDEAAVSSTILAHNTAYGHGASNPGPGNPSNGSFTNYRVTYEQDTTPHASSNLITEKILTDIGTINATGILGEFQNLSIIS